MMDFQTTIPTLDRVVMEDLATEQFGAHGVLPTIECCLYKGVPLYLMHCGNGVSYVCTRAQMLYFTKNLAGNFTFRQDASAFRVYPEMSNMQHREKGAQYGVTYTSLAKSHEYGERAVLAI